MDTLLTNFIRALRNADVRISTAETLDALRAVDSSAIAIAQLLKDSARTDAAEDAGREE